MKDDVPFLRDSEIEQEAALLLAEYARDHQLVLEPPVPIRCGGRSASRSST